MKTALATSTAILLMTLASNVAAQDLGRMLGRVAERAAERAASRTLDNATRPERSPAPRPSRPRGVSRQPERAPPAPGAPPLPSEIGVNTPVTTAVADNRVSAAENRAMHARLRGLLRIVHAQPGLASLNGFSLRSSIHTRSGPLPTIHHGQALTLITLPTTGGSDCPSRDGLKASQCGPGLTIRVNDPQAAVLQDAGSFRGHVQLPMTPPPRQNGFDVFRNGDEVVLTRSRPGVPVFLPMSREEYLTYMDTPSARQELATLSPQERAERACGATRRTILRTCEPNDLYMARPNPAYFDPAKGRTSVQLVTLSYFERGTPRHDVILAGLATLRAEDIPLD